MLSDSVTSTGLSLITVSAKNCCSFVCTVGHLRGGSSVPLQEDTVTVGLESIDHSRPTSGTSPTTRRSRSSCCKHAFGSLFSFQQLHRVCAYNFSRSDVGSDNDELTRYSLSVGAVRVPACTCDRVCRPLWKGSTALGLIAKARDRLVKKNGEGEKQRRSVSFSWLF